VLLILIILFISLLFPKSVSAVAADNYRWVEYGDGLVSYNVAGLVVDPNNGDVAYMASPSGGIF
jgi:hypothetical protein